MSSGSNIFTRSLSRVYRRKKQRAVLTEMAQDAETIEHNGGQFSHLQQLEQPASKGTLLGRGMDRLRKSLRLPRRKDRAEERQTSQLSPSTTQTNGKQEQWQPDEAAVRAGVCSFNVKYLGAVEVFESRGMQVCEGALKAMKTSKKKPIKAVLYVSGDGLRVVDQENNRGLIVDQTIEKVSFCAPDRHNTKGFAYICRDGSTRRWMCHGFYASKCSGERLSHAVGCAFAICLEKKKKRDDEHAQTSETAPASTSVEASLNPDWSDNHAAEADPMAQRVNPAYQSFRKQVSISERLQDPQSVIVAAAPHTTHSTSKLASGIAKPRPAPKHELFLRQGSLRAPPDPQPVANQFKRNFSLRPSNSSTSTLDSPKKVYGKSLYNEPIVEDDEDPFGLGIGPTTATAQSKNPIVRNGLDGIDLQYTGPAPQPMPHPSAYLTNQPTHFANWPIDKPIPVQKQNGVQDFATISVNTSAPPISSTSSSFPSSRSKADLWLNDILRTSLTISPPISEATHQVECRPSSSQSGPPPSHPPPPLPTKEAVSRNTSTIMNGNAQSRTNGSSPISTTDGFGQTINWEVTPTRVPVAPVDPFDVQWSQQQLI